jgi:hypothetical protein
VLVSGVHLKPSTLEVEHSGATFAFEQAQDVADGFQQTKYTDR